MQTTTGDSSPDSCNTYRTEDAAEEEETSRHLKYICYMHVIVSYIIRLLYPILQVAKIGKCCQLPKLEFEHTGVLERQ